MENKLTESQINNQTKHFIETYLLPVIEQSQSDDQKPAIAALSFISVALKTIEHTTGTKAEAEEIFTHFTDMILSSWKRLP